MPRPNTTNTPAAHPAAARAAAPAQKKHPTAHLRPEETPRTSTTTIRIHKLTKIKPGFEYDTEKELSRIFKRPMRTFHEDPPFYPWLPPEPRVNFNLNFKF